MFLRSKKTDDTASTGVHLSEARVPEGVRIYAIGDVHGREDCLRQLHEKIIKDLRTNPIKRFIVIHLGDYVDRGPASAEVIEFCTRLQKNKNVLFLLGNHEQEMVRFIDSPVEEGDFFLSYGGLNTLESYGVKARNTSDAKERIEIRNEFVSKIPETHVTFLRNLPLRHIIGDYFFCHAGIDPRLPLNRQPDQTLLYMREPFLGWERLFDQVIVHGHTPTSSPEVRPNRINVDTMAYKSGALTAVVLEGLDFWFLQT